MLIPDPDDTFLALFLVFFVAPTILLVGIAALGTWLNLPKPKKKVNRLCVDHAVKLRPGQMCILDSDNCTLCKKGKKR